MILTRRHSTAMVRIEIAKRSLNTGGFKPQQVIGAIFRYILVQVISSDECSKGIHGHNECISTEHITMGVKILYDIIKEFCT